MFLRYRIFGTLTKDNPEENEDQMKYDAFFCFRSVIELPELLMTIRSDVLVMIF